MPSRLTVPELIFLEVSPPGREPQVRALKGKVGNPYAVAWASYNKEKEGGPGSGIRGHTTDRNKRQPIAKDLDPRTGIPRSTLRSLPKSMRIHYTKLMHKQANSSGGLPQTLRGRKTEEGGPGSGRHPSGRTTPLHNKRRGQLTDPKARATVAKALKSFHSRPSTRALLRRMQGMGAESKTVCGTDWGKSMKDMEGGPGSGRHPYGGKGRFAQRPKNTGLRHVGGATKSDFRSFKKLGIKLKPSTVKWLKQPIPAIGMVQADILILNTLLKESVVKSTYRFSESTLMEVVAPVVPGVSEFTVPEGPMVKCVLITEGLGNRADMHYYGPECIKNGVPLFEGQPCFIDHQKRSEQQDQPERTVRDKCGYFKNVRAENIDGRLGLVAELHYDLSETGKYAYDKACTAIHFKQEFPDSDKEYVGLSIAADGRLEERVMQVGDETLDVKYVTEFTAVGSVDEVTSPARGGRFVQVLSR